MLDAMEDEKLEALRVKVIAKLEELLLSNKNEIALEAAKSLAEMLSAHAAKNP